MKLATCLLWVPKIRLHPMEGTEPRVWTEIGGGHWTPIRFVIRIPGFANTRMHLKFVSRLLKSFWRKSNQSQRKKKKPKETKKMNKIRNKERKKKSFLKVCMKLIRKNWRVKKEMSSLDKHEGINWSQFECRVSLF